MSAPSAQSEATAAEVWRLLLTCAMSQFGRTASIAQGLGLTPGHVKALLALDPNEPQAMGSLAQNFACDASTMTWLVDRLEEKGLVQRKGLMNDRRVKTVALTPEGVKTKEELESRMYEPPAFILDLDREVLQSLHEVLGGLATAAKQ
jgi:MarR family transcriptional regulator, organic hydroperoxide resistance regulator